MTRRTIAVGGVLSLVVLTAAIMAAQFPATGDEEQAGSLAPFTDVPRPVPDHFEQQARNLYVQSKDKIAGKIELSRRDTDLKTALGRYFADAKIEQAIELLESVVTEAEGTPEARRAASAIRLLRPDADERSPIREDSAPIFEVSPTALKPTKGMKPVMERGKQPLKFER